MDYINKICELLKQKQENNELFSRDDINKIIKWIVNEEQLHDYVKKIIFNNDIDSYARYTKDSLSISINFKKNIVLDNNFDNNINLVHIIFHELNHAKQYKIIETNAEVDDLEKERLTLELVLKGKQITENKNLLINNSQEISFKAFLKIIQKIIKIRNFYKNSKGYISHFSERQAEFDAIEKCQLILESIDSEEALELNDIYRRAKYKIALSGYKKLLFDVKYPYQYFQKNVDIYDPKGIINLNFDNCQSLEERLMHGFHITKKEFEEIDLLAHTHEYPNIKINKISNRKK